MGCGCEYLCVFTEARVKLWMSFSTLFCLTDFRQVFSLAQNLIISVRLASQRALRIFLFLSLMLVLQVCIGKPSFLCES